MRSTLLRTFRWGPLRSTAISALLVFGISSIPISDAAAAPEPQNPQWAAAMSFGSSGLDTGYAVRVDREGNRYVTGSFSNTATFPNQFQSSANPGVKATATHLTSAGGLDFFLAKYDHDGTLLWVVEGGGTGDDIGYGMDFDASGNVYVAGSITNSATFHGVNSKNLTVPGADLTTFIAKYSASGALQWVQTGATAGGGGGENNGFGVAVEPVSGSVFVTGMGQSDLAFSSSDGSSNVVSGPGTWHMVLAKYNTDGKFMWGETNAAEVNSISYRVAVDTNANAYVIGWMEGNTTFGSSDSNSITVTGFSFPIQSAPDYPNDAFIAKYDTAGVLKWVNHLGGYKATATDVAVSPYGEISITGFIGNVNASGQNATIVTSQPGGSSINLGGGTFTTPFNKDIFVASYSTAGVLLDARRYGSSGDDEGSGIAYDVYGNLILAGAFERQFHIGSLALDGAQNVLDPFVVKFERPQTYVEGSAALILSNAQWVKTASGPLAGSFEQRLDMNLTPYGNVLLTGAFQPSAQFGTVKLTSSGQADGFVVCLDKHGQSSEPGGTGCH